MNVCHVLLLVLLASSTVDAFFGSRPHDDKNHHGPGCGRTTAPTTPRPCTGYRCPISGKCIGADEICDGQVQCNGRNVTDTSDELNCRPTCCDNELVLNYTTLGSLFQVSFSEDGVSCPGVQPVDLAFRGSNASYKTRCPSYDVIIDVTAFTEEGFWDVCYVGYKTKNIKATTIIIDDLEITHTSSPVNQVVNTTASGVIVINVQLNDNSPSGGYGRRPPEGILSNIEVVLCLPPSDTCFLEDVIIPANTTRQDINGNICIFPNDIVTQKCNGTCNTTAAGNAMIVDSPTGIPTIPPIVKDCTCCSGAGHWVYYDRIPCFLPTPLGDIGAPTTSGVFGVFQMRTCACNRCPAAAAGVGVSNTAW